MESEIVHETAALVTALACGDAVAAADIYSDGARVVAPAAGVLDGRAEIEAYWQAGIDLGLAGLAFESQVLEEIGGGALEIGRYAVSGQADLAGPRVERGTYLVLHTLDRCGSWRRTVEIFNPDEPNAARGHIQREEP